MGTEDEVFFNIRASLALSEPPMTHGSKRSLKVAMHVCKINNVCRYPTPISSGYRGFLQS